MGQRKCCVPECKSSSHLPECSEMKFHAFPTNNATRNIWLKNCRIDQIRSITKNNVVCSKHFHDSDYQVTKNDRRMLGVNAVPTVFSWGNEKSFSEHMDTSEAIPDTSANESATKTTEIPSDNTAVTKSKKMSSRSQANIADDKQRSASAEEQSSTSANKKVNKVRKSLDLSNTSDKTPSKDNVIKSPSKKFDIAMQLTPGAKVEAQDLTGSWHNASVVEVDQGEQEVLINFEKTVKGKGASGFKLNEEWIAMDSTRLRIPVQVTFKEGDRCLARWTDSRKFPATVVRPLDNNKYEVLFDDGLVKYVKGIHMSKTKRTASEKASQSCDSPTILGAPVTPVVTPIQPIIRKPFKINPIPKFDLSKFNLPEIPEGEWCCPWINDTPIGDEGFLLNADGTKRPTVLVQDKRLPAGWTKHLYQRSSTSGKWDVVLVGPNNNKRFRSKNDVKLYLEEIGQPYNLDIYDFSIHKRRAKDVGVYVFTNDYVPPVIPKPSSDFKLDSSLDSSFQQEPFTGFTPNESTSTILSKITKEIKAETSTPIKTEPNTSALEEGFTYVGALKVKLVDNLFQCPKDDCKKNFRKENHLQIHVKHYHQELSQQLGACPNMTELAYFRTMGTSIDESSPKNQIPNSQFFEKTYTSEMRTVRKSLSPTRIKVEPKTEEPSTSSQMIIDETTNEGLKRKLTTNQGSPEIKEKRKPSATDKVNPPEFSANNSKDFKLDDIEMGAIVSTPVKKSESKSAIDSKPTVQKAIIPRFKIGNMSKLKGKKTSPRKGKTFKKKFKKFNKDFKRKSYEVFGNRLPIQRDSGIFGGSFSRQSRPNRLKFLQYSSTDSNSESSIMDPNFQQRSGSQYVDENGEIIKIVRMRQEEIINCVCKYGEEDGLMIQCELCLCWQHGGCNNIEKESEVPEKYVCWICRHPDNIRESMRYVHDQDWLYDGKLFHANYHQPSRQAAMRSDILKQSHTLTGNLLELKRSLHSLNVKINIASNKDHPKLYLWSKKWEQSPPRNAEANVETKVEPKPAIQAQHLTVTEVKNETEPNPESNTSQKCTENESNLIKEEEPTEKTNSTANETESVLKNETTPIENKADNDVKTETKNKATTQQPIKQAVIPKNVVRPTPNIPKPEAAIDSVECQHRLLEHVQKEQNTILSRMQTIDAQIVALESMDDHPYTNTDADFAKTSQTIRMLLNDLAKMKKLATINRISRKDPHAPLYNSIEPSHFI
ncbi:PHD finger protein 20-like protein 1 [Contarinia nasturtii]|uniref:PHD finger protein 20-like protein 1 n=1 Tax=Contarinia nasturtii TaxID=265458 RepID=UPI0012D478BA|nr:PHD finger protein 20-like protein 1 [Contarinia nasturtii]